MGIRVTIKGTSDEIKLEKDLVTSVKYISDTPNNSNARATDLSIGVEIVGKISNEANDETKKLSLWSLVPAESLDAYKSVTLEVITAGVVIRKFVMPNSFMVDYTEDFDVLNGSGVFTMILKQKKEKIPNVLIEGGYNA